MSKHLNRTFTCTTSLKCVIKTQVKLLTDILFPFTVTDNLNLATEEITFHQNLIDEMIGVIKEFKEIDRYIKNLISRVSLCTKFIGKPFTPIQYGPEQSQVSNLMVLVKDLTTFTQIKKM